MGFGTLGSTLNDELNRLANGGTYRDKDDMVDEALAAKQWANLENIVPYSTDTVGVLNEIAALGPNRQNWFDFNGVCNYLAGTTGLPAAAALRQITTTGDILTSLAAYYIDATDASASTQTITNLGNAGSLLPTTLGSTATADSNDPKFLDWTGENYVYLPGVASNRLSVPDEAALDITGDIDLRAYVALDDWTPAAASTFVGKFGAAGNRSYRLDVNTNGTLNFRWSEDGTATVNTTGQNSTVAPTITDGQPLWVRVTLDVDNGASGYDVKFFTSTDGTTWTQLGTTVTGGATTSIYSGTANVEVGAFNSGANNPAAGKFYRAQILNGIDGTTVLDVDTSVITAGSATSFTAVTGQTVTINRSTSGRKTVAVTQPTWLFGTDDYMEVNNRYMAYSGSNYLYLPGVSGNDASAPDSAALDITGDIDVRCKVALDDWTPAAFTILISKYTNTAPNRAYQLGVNTSGALSLIWSTDGTGPTAIEKLSTVATGITDGTVKWVRATLDVDNGNSENEVEFFLSDDGTNWTQLGTTVTTAGTTSIYSSPQGLRVGSSTGGTAALARGKFFRAQVLDGIGGTTAFDADFETSITSLLQTTFTESSLNAATVTINRSGDGFESAGITQAGYLYPGATNTFSASTTDFLNFGASDSFTFMVIVRQWATATAAGPYINKISQIAATGQGWYLNPADMRIGDGTTRLIRTYTGPTAGTLGTLVGVRNTVADNIIVYANGTASDATTDTTTGTLANQFITMIGRTSYTGTFQDFELVGAAVFRTVLTPVQIRQITNYFANREVYL